MSNLLNMFTLLGIFSNIVDDVKAFVWKIVIVLIVVVLLVALIKTPKTFLPVFCTVVGVVLIAVTAYSAIQLNYYYSASGGIYGVITGLYSTNVVEVDVEELSFNITNIEMTETDTDVYSATMTTNAITGLEDSTNYIMCVNGTPCYSNVYGTKYIQSKYSYTFYDDDLEVILTDTLTINMAFYTNYTSVKVTTSSGYSAVKLWHNLFNNDNFVITLVSSDYISNSDLSYSTEGDLSNYCIISFIDETNNTTESAIYTIGDTIEFPALSDTTTSYFLGWSTDKETTIDTTDYTASETTTFYALFKTATSGLFDENGTCLYSWDSLVDGGYITLSDNTITDCDGSLTGVLIIDNSITSIGSSAFYQCDFISVTVPENVTEIGKRAFFECKHLTTMNLVNCTSITTIDIDTFRSCTSLVDVCLPNSFEIIGDYAFYGCTSLLDINLEDTSISSIGEYSFYNCASLLNLSFPNSLSSIDSCAFSGCAVLASIDLNNCANLASIGSSAFSNCVSLLSVDFSNCINLTTIGAAAFQSCSLLNNIVFLNDISSIGNMCFYRCESLVSVDLGSLSVIGYGMFIWCTSLSNIVFSSSLTSISDYAFNTCSSLTSVDMSACSNLITINEYAFGGCSSLTSIDMSACSNLVTICYGAFSSCTKLSYIVLSSSLTTIESLAFYSCYKLTSIWIPKSVTTISATTYSSSPFYSCSSGLVIYCEAENTQSEWDTCWNYRNDNYPLTTYYGYTYAEYLEAIS